jgi:drug/metabolite transporter (DMT)-like permease
MSPAALGLALVAALASAGGVVLQSRSVRAVGDRSGGVVALFRRLLRIPLWWCGIALAGPVVVVFHTSALHEGTLIEVEAIMVSSLLFALAFGAGLTHQPVSRRDWRSAALVVAGVGISLGSSDPHGDDYTVALGVWLAVGALVVGAVAVLATVARRTRHDNVRAAAWGASAGVLLGTSAVLLKYLSTLFDQGLGTVVSSPALWALLVAELVALVCQQLAFRSGSFAAALAPIVGGNPLIAGAIGVVVFQERFHRTPTDLVVAGIGLVLVGIGIATLAASPMVAVGSGEVVPATGDG